MDNEKKLNLEISPEVARGTYSNMVLISHSHSEVVLDFAAVYPGPKSMVQSRIVLNPEHAKRLLLALADNIGKYEKQFGTIELGRQQETPQMTINLADIQNNGSKS